MAILFALLSSLFIGLNTIVIRKSLDRANPFTIAILLTVVGAVFFWFLGALTLTPEAIVRSPTGNVLFIVAGLFAPALVRWIFFASIHRVGASISSSILAAIPAFAALIAVVFLDERPTLAMGAGLLLIVAGIVVFERDIQREHQPRSIARRDLLLPLLAALVGAIAINFRKVGLEEINLPILGAGLGFTSALVFYALILLLSARLRRSFRFRLRDMPFFVAGGLSLALGWLSIFYALSNGPVVLVAPLASLHPLVVLALGLVFFRDLERVSFRTVLGSCAVLFGVALILAFQHPP